MRIETNAATIQATPVRKPTKKETAIAGTAMDIRGYGPVKMQAVAKVQKETDDMVRLLKSWMSERRAA